MKLSPQALRAFTWSALGEAASRALGPIVFLVLARLLVPEDFGVVAAATVVISFSQIFTDAGLAKALIQHQGDSRASADAMFWLNVALGILVTAVVMAGAPEIAKFFHDPRITDVVRLLSIQILLSALSATHAALLQKALDFRSLFWIRLLSTSLPAAASIGLALGGFGYWALVAGSIAGQMIQTTLLWRASDWRPARTFGGKSALELMAFGKWAMMSGLLGWFYVWMDAVMVGHFLGAHDMGLYRTGNALVGMLYGLVFTPILPVLYTLFSRIQDDLPSLKSALQMVARTLALTGLPIGVFLIANGDDIANALFGPEWAGLGSVIGVLGLMHACTWIVGANGEAYRAIGKPEVETWTNGALMPVYFAGYLLTVQSGLLAFIHTRLLLGIAGTLFHIIVAARVLDLPVSRWIPAKAVLVYALAGVIASQSPFGVEQPVFRVLLAAVLFSAVAAAGLYLVEKKFILKLVNVLPLPLGAQTRQ